MEEKKNINTNDKENNHEYTKEFVAGGIWGLKISCNKIVDSFTGLSRKSSKNEYRRRIEDLLYYAQKNLTAIKNGMPDSQNQSKENKNE